MKNLLLSFILFTSVHSMTVGQSNSGPVSIIDLEKILAFSTSEFSNYLGSNGFVVHSGKTVEAYLRDKEGDIILLDRKVDGIGSSTVMIAITSNDRYLKIKNSLSAEGYENLGTTGGKSNYKKKKTDIPSRPDVLIEVTTDGTYIIQLGTWNIEVFRQYVSRRSRISANKVEKISEPLPASPRVAADRAAPANVVQPASAQAQTPVNSNKAKLVFIRTTGYQGFAFPFPAFIDDNLVCRLNNKKFSVHEVAVGEHTVSVQFGGEKSKRKAERVKIAMEAGKTYYVQMVFQSGAFVNNLYCQEVTENSAKPIMADLKEDANCL